MQLVSRQFVLLAACRPVTSEGCLVPVWAHAVMLPDYLLGTVVVWSSFKRIHERSLLAGRFVHCWFVGRDGVCVHEPEWNVCWTHGSAGCVEQSLPSDDAEQAAGHA